jgi:hypothetical protein
MSDGLFPEAKISGGRFFPRKSVKFRILRNVRDNKLVEGNAIALCNIQNM